MAAPASCASPSRSSATRMSGAARARSRRRRSASSTPGGFDCSGFVWRVYKLQSYAGAPQLERRPPRPHDHGDERRGREGRRASTFDELQPADVIFFGSRGPKSKPAQVDHTGIYLGNGWFIHSSGYGVALARLDGWYASSFAWARRPLIEAKLELGPRDPPSVVISTAATTNENRDVSIRSSSSAEGLTMLQWKPRFYAVLTLAALAVGAFGGYAGDRRRHTPAVRLVDRVDVSVRAGTTATAARRAGARLHARAHSRLPAAAVVVRAPGITRPGRCSGLAALLAASMFAERFPVPVEGADAGGVSLLYVFVVATTVLYGWEAGALLAAIGTFTQLLQHRPPIRVIYNASVFGGAAALAGPLDPAGSTRRPSAGSSLASASPHSSTTRVNLAAHHARRRRAFAALVHRCSCGRTRVGTILPFALMASAALMLVVLWQRSAVLVGRRSSAR